MVFTFIFFFINFYSKKDESRSQFSHLLLLNTMHLLNQKETNLRKISSFWSLPLAIAVRWVFVKGFTESQEKYSLTSVRASVLSLSFQVNSCECLSFFSMSATCAFYSHSVLSCYFEFHIVLLARKRDLLSKKKF